MADARNRLISSTMETRALILLRHAPTTATDARAFPADEVVEAPVLERLAEEDRLPHVDRCVVSPTRRAVQTAEALRQQYVLEPRISECHFGSWRGKSVAEIAELDPASFGHWLADPDASPHGGESLRQIADRVDDFMLTASQLPGTTLAVTHGGVIKIAVARALNAPLRSMWQVRSEPLTLTTIEWTHDSWELVASNVPLERR